MLTWLLTLVEGIGLNWLYGKATDFISQLIDYFKAKSKISEDQKQAAIVQAIADQIKALLLAGQPIPPELEESLREESQKLITDNPPDVNSTIIK